MFCAVVGCRVHGVTNYFSSFINAPNLLCTLLGTSEALYGRIAAASSNFTPDFTNCDVKGCFVAACGQKLISIHPRAAQLLGRAGFIVTASFYARLNDVCE